MSLTFFVALSFALVTSIAMLTREVRSRRALEKLLRHLFVRKPEDASEEPPF